MTLVAGIDSSTQSCKVLVCDAETGVIVRSASRPHPGGTEVRLRLLSAERTTTFQLADDLRVQPSQPLIADLKALLGPSCLAV